MRRVGVVLVGALLAVYAFAEVQVIGGKKYECRDGVCYLAEDDATTNSVNTSIAISESGGPGEAERIRIAQGYMRAEEFIAFLENKGVDSLAGRGIWALLILVLLGGLAMNLTPCVLPLVPINLMIIGRSAKRGAAYGLGIALAYGVLGAAAALGGLAFGAIQGSPWFNAFVALVFAALSLSFFDVFFIDLSRFRPSLQALSTKHQALFPFLMGSLSAVLAGACVAPALISVLLLTADLASNGNRLAILLPFVMGLGMALPWPFAGAGMRVLPKPGRWMKYVNRVFGILVLGFAGWYGNLALQGFQGAKTSRFQSLKINLQAFKPSDVQTVLAQARRPILVDCWASWCKNCSAMDGVLDEMEVKKALEPFTVIRVQAEDISELRKVKGFESIQGLPAFVIFE